MPDSQKITGTLRGKLLITFGLLLILSLVFWVINKKAFRDINTVVSELALPNEKQILLGSLHEGLSELIAGQRRETLNNSPEPSDWYIARSDQIKGSIDSLTQLFRNEPVQLRRMHYIDSIFDRQSTVYKLYLKNRYYFLKTDLRKEQLDSLDKDIQTNKIVLDSSVTSWENTTKTYTLLPPIKLPENTDTKNKRRQLRKNNREPDSDTSSGLRIMVEKTSNVHTDTLEIHPQKDSLMRRIEHSFSSVESLRQQKLDYLRHQEKQLLNNNQQLLSQLIEAIEKVRLDEISSAQFNAKQSILIAEDAVALTERLTFIFLFIAGTLLLLIVWDLSRMNSYRRQLELSKAEAEYHSTAKQRFLSNMSHEIRTPLQSIIGFAELLRHEVPPENRHIQPLLRSSDHLLQVVNEILDYSRVISGKLAVRPAPFNLKQTLDELSETAAWDCSRKSLKWDYLETPAIFPNCTVLGDELRLRQLLFNLIGNAVKYTSSGTIGLTVRSEFDKGILHAHFEVSDTGEGIPADQLQTIFEAFEQNESHYTKGTGLGLSIVKELVDSMHGSVMVESTVGEGSVFTVHLSFPLAEEVIPSGKEQFGDLLPMDGTVWVIDDDAPIRSLCARILEQEGVSYRCFDTAEAVLAHPWDERLQLILCDFRLPGMDGGQLCQKLKESHPEVPIIALTAQVLPEERNAVLAYGFDEVLLKPFKKREFLAAIARFTRNKAVDFDWKLLSQMIDDPNERKVIIAEFCDECRADIRQLKEAIERANTETVLLLVHRLAGRTEQMGGKHLGSLFRKAEREGRAGQNFFQLQEQVQGAIQALEAALDRL